MRAAWLAAAMLAAPGAHAASLYSEVKGRRIQKLEYRLGEKAALVLDLQVTRTTVLADVLTTSNPSFKAKVYRDVTLKLGYKPLARKPGAELHSELMLRFGR